MKHRNEIMLTVALITLGWFALLFMPTENPDNMTTTKDIAIYAMINFAAMIPVRHWIKQSK